MRTSVNAEVIFPSCAEVRIPALGSACSHSNHLRSFPVLEAQLNKTQSSLQTQE